MDARSRIAKPKAPAMQRARNTVDIATARMHAMRRHPRRRQALFPLRLSAAAPAARHHHPTANSAWSMATRRVTLDTGDPIVRAQWHAMLAYIASERGYQRGWIAHKYNEKFGTWPPRNAVAQPTPPTPEVRSWVRSRMIAFAKGRRSA